jgi:hypothetical protein
MHSMVMNKLPQKVPRSFIEHNEEWLQTSIISDLHLLRWKKKGSNLVATSIPGSPYCDIHEENEESVNPSRGFGLSSEMDQNSGYGSSTPGVNDLRSSRDMLVKMLGQDTQHSQQATNIRNYLSSAYLNPRLKSGLRFPSLWQKNEHY